MCDHASSTRHTAHNPTLFSLPTQRIYFRCHLAARHQQNQNLLVSAKGCAEGCCCITLACATFIATTCMRRCVITTTIMQVSSTHCASTHGHCVSPLVFYSCRACSCSLFLIVSRRNSPTPIVNHVELPGMRLAARLVGLNWTCTVLVVVAVGCCGRAPLFTPRVRGSPFATDPRLAQGGVPQVLGEERCH